MATVHILPKQRRVMLASAAHAVTTPVLSNEVVLGNYEGVIVSIDVTAVTLTPSVVFTLQHETPQGDWVSVLASAAVTTTGDTTLTVGPGVATVANVALGTHMFDRIRVQAVGADTDSITYSVHCMLVP